MVTQGVSKGELAVPVGATGLRRTIVCHLSNNLGAEVPVCFSDAHDRVSFLSGLPVRRQRRTFLSAGHVLRIYLGSSGIVQSNFRRVSSFARVMTFDNRCLTTRRIFPMVIALFRLERLQ